MGWSVSGPLFLVDFLLCSWRAVHGLISNAALRYAQVALGVRDDDRIVVLVLQHVEVHFVDVALGSAHECIGCPALASLRLLLLILAP